MRFSATIAAAAAIAPAAVSATGKLGFSLGVRNSGTPPPCKQYADFQQDFKTLLNPKDGSVKPSIVRTYAAVDGGADGIPGAQLCSVTGELLKAASEAGIQVLLGLWLSTNQTTYAAEIAETIKYAKQYENTIYAYTVGSEGLYREQLKQGTGYDAKYLAKSISQLKSALKGVGVDKKVGTADSWNKFQDGTADEVIKGNDDLPGGAELLLVNAFGYWQASDISNAHHTYLDDLYQAFAHIQDQSGSIDKIELWNGETGWPSDGGSDYSDASKSKDTAVASDKNAQTFWTEGVCAALDMDINVFYFEAFAEDWKPPTKGDTGREGDERHWGAYDVGRNAVINDLSCSYKSS